MSMSVRTILIVDDEPAQRQLMGGILRHEAYAVLEACDYAEALAVDQRHHGEIDLVLIDLSLPGRNGYELFQALRAREPWLRVLFVSGNAGAALRRFFDELASDVHFLPKPFTPAELLEHVQSVLAAPDPSPGRTSV